MVVQHSTADHPNNEPQTCGRWGSGGKDAGKESEFANSIQLSASLCWRAVGRMPHISRNPLDTDTPEPQVFKSFLGSAVLS